MADLNDLQSAQTVKIAGADPITGIEDNFMEVDSSGRVTSKANDGSGNPLTSTNNGGKQALDVNVTNSFAAGTADKSTFTYGTTIESAIGGVYQDTSPALTAGQQGAVRLTQNRSFHSNLRNDSGIELATASNPIRVDPTGTTPQPASQSGTWNITNISGTVSLPTGASTAANQATQLTALQIIDDLPHTQNDALVKGVPIMGQLDDTSTIAATEDKVAVARITAQRALHTNLRDNSGTELATSSNPVRTDPTGTTTQPTSVVSQVTNTDKSGAGAIVALNGTVVATTNGCSSVTFNITGTWVASLAIEATTNGSDWFAIQGLVQSSGTLTTGVGANCTITINCGGFSQARIKASSYTSGTAAISWDASAGINAVWAYNTSSQAFHAQVDLKDGSGTAVTSSATTGLNASKQAIDVNVVPPAINYYSAPVQIRQSATTAANGTVFSMRNAAASTRTVYIERINLSMFFDTGTPLGRSLQRYSLCRFSAATPSTGTTETVIEMDNANPSTQVTDVRFLDTGLTTTSVSFESAFAIIGCPAVDGSVSPFVREGISFKLAAGEGFCIRLTVTAVIGQGLAGEIVWSER